MINWYRIKSNITEILKLWLCGVRLCVECDSLSTEVI